MISARQARYRLSDKAGAVPTPRQNRSPSAARVALRGSTPSATRCSRARVEVAVIWCRTGSCHFGAEPPLCNWREKSRGAWTFPAPPSAVRRVRRAHLLSVSRRAIPVAVRDRGRWGPPWGHPPQGATTLRGTRPCTRGRVRTGIVILAASGRGHVSDPSGRDRGPRGGVVLEHAAPWRSTWRPRLPEPAGTGLPKATVRDRSTWSLSPACARRAHSAGPYPIHNPIHLVPHRPAHSRGVCVARSRESAKSTQHVSRHG